MKYYLKKIKEYISGTFSGKTMKKALAFCVVLLVFAEMVAPLSKIQDLGNSYISEKAEKTSNYQGYYPHDDSRQINGISDSDVTSASKKINSQRERVYTGSSSSGSSYSSNNGSSSIKKAENRGASQTQQGLEKASRMEEIPEQTNPASPVQDPEDAGMPSQTFSGRAGSIVINVEADEDTFPAGTRMGVKVVYDQSVIDSVAQCASEGARQIEAVDITFYDKKGNEIEPLKPVRVSMASEKIGASESTQVVHVDNSGNAESVSTGAPAESSQNEVTFDSHSFSVYALIFYIPVSEPEEPAEDPTTIDKPGEAPAEDPSATDEPTEEPAVEPAITEEPTEEPVIPEIPAEEGPRYCTRTYEGDNYSIELTYSEEALIPEDTVLAVYEILPGTEEYDIHYAAAAYRLGVSRRGISYARFFDIRFEKDGVAIEPLSDVGVKITYSENAEIGSADKANIVHFGEEEAEVIDTDETESNREISFSTDSFSVYSVIYTVDFHWTVNGKTYSYGFEGGSYARLSEIVSALNLTDSSVEEFMSEISEVFFSNSELVFVARIEDKTTVGQIRNYYCLDTVYSCNLSEEKIVQIDSETVSAGDWILIGVAPFNTEEKLTVRMDDGEEFAILVTDAQIAKNYLSADGNTYAITVTYDDSAEIPAGTDLVVDEIDLDTEEFMQYVARTLAEVNKAYYEEQELLNIGVDPDCVQHFEPLSIDQARFFHITLMYEGREIEPKTPVQVDIKYIAGLGVDGIEECIPGVVHFTNCAVEVISEVKTRTNEEGKIVDFNYTQNSFSDIGIFIGHEGRDRLMAAGAPAVDLKSSGNGETTSVTDFKEENGAPEASKVLNDNGDGTYTLALHVKPQSSEYVIVPKKANVLFVMDRSSSMNRNSDDSYLSFNNESDAIAALRNGVNVYGYYDNKYNPISYISDSGVWTSSAGVYDTTNGLFYGLAGSRLSQEQAALNDLIGQLMGKNEGAGRSDDIEISVISFATYTGTAQVYSYVGGTASANWGGSSSHQNDPAYRWGLTEAGWTGGTDTTALNNAVNNNSMARGTNWEEALKYAKNVMDAKKSKDGEDEDYYVVFLTDGAPTATSESIENHDSAYEWGAWYGDNGGAGYTNGQGIPYAYDDAKDDALALVSAGYKLFNIFTYGEGDDYKYMVRLTNYAYSGGTDDTTNTTTEAVGQYFKNATNTSELVDYFNTIFKEITGNIGHSQVKIKDGLTTGAMTSTFVEGKPSAVRYTVTPGEGSTMRPYTVQATMPEEGSEPVVTFTINGNKYTTTSGAVRKTMNPEGSYDAGVCYSVTVGGVEYKMALASVDNSGELTWDLTPMGVLWDDCDYKAEFVVWPRQEAYNYVAGLNNGMDGFEWDESAASQHEHIDSKGRKYWSNGVADYPSIVKYEDGTFAVLTNTHQELEYSVSQVENGELIGSDGPFTEGLNFPDPMPLTATRTNLEKQWNVDRNPAILAQYLYNPDGTPTEFVASFDIFSDNDEDPFATVSLGWDSEQGKYVWDESSLRRVVYAGHVLYVGTRWSDEISIATGLMLSYERMLALGLNPSEYPKATYDGTTYYILERGHDYHVKENEAGDDLGYEFDFESPVFHPMLVDGRMVNIIFESEMDEDGPLSLTEPYPIEEMIPAPLNSIGSLVVENTLRGYINVEKIVVDKDGKTVKSDDTTKFSYDVVLENPIEPGPFTEEGSNIPWYGINDLYYHAENDGKIYYYQAEPMGGNLLSLTTESGKKYTAETVSGDDFDPDTVGPTEIRFTDEDSNVVTLSLRGNEMVRDSDNRVHDTIQIMQGQTLNIANVPKGTTYTITESISDPDYDLMSIVWRIKDGDVTVKSGKVDDISSGSITGEIVSNRDNRIIFTNKIHSADLRVKKLDEEGRTLLGAQFTLTKANTESETDTLTWTLPEEGTVDTGTYTFIDLPDGVYTLTEMPPANYTGIAPITFVVIGGKVYMPGDTLPADYTLPAGVTLSALPDGVTWTGNTFTLAVKNSHVQPQENEIRVEKRWEDEDGNPAEGSRDVKVQLRRYMPAAHNVTVIIHSDGWSGGAEINYSRTFTAIYGDKVTIEFAKPIYFAQNFAPPVSSTSGTVQDPTTNGNNWCTVINNVSSDITVTIDYTGYNWQLVNQNNNPPIQNTVTVSGNSHGGDGNYVPDPNFPAQGDTKATQTLTPSNGYSYTWKFGEGNDYDYPAASYKYYIVELDENDQPVDAGQGSLISITNNDGILTGIITATNKINGSLMLKKQVSAVQGEDVSSAAGKYNFTVTGPGETGTTKYVQIRIDTEGAVTYKVSNSDISFNENEGFVSAPSDGSVLIPDLVAGTYKVTEGEYQLDDDQDGKYTMNLGQIEVESGTPDISKSSATLTVRAESTPSAAATFTNMLVPMVDVPVVKNWQWSENDQDKVASWTATFNLEYREVLVSGEEAEDAKHSWTPVYETNGTTQKSITLRFTDSVQEKFEDLPLYKTHDNGSVYRVIYAVDEVAYTITYNDGRDPGTETWSKSESGHMTEHYSPDYEQDAGEGNMPGTGLADWYTIHLTNVRSTKEIEKTIDLSLEKKWEDEELYNDPDSRATFQLKRTYHEEYLDYSKHNLDPNDLVTVKLDLNGGITKELVVPRGAPVYVTAVVKPGKTASLTFNKTGRMIVLSGGDSESTSQQFITADSFEADNVTVSFSSGNTSVLVGGLDGIGLASFDPGDTTEEREDEAFINQSAGQKITLNAANGWKNEWVELPQLVQEMSETENGIRMKTIVYSYYLEEIEEECYPKNFEVTFREGQGDKDNPMISSGSVVAENKLETTELSGTKTWSISDLNSSYVLGTPILKLSRRTEIQSLDEGGNPVTTLTEPEDVTVSWEGEEQYLQPTWYQPTEQNGYSRSFKYTDLPKRDKDGNMYVYNVEEVEFTVGAGGNEVTYYARRQDDGTYIVTSNKPEAEMFTVQQNGNDIINEPIKTNILIQKVNAKTKQPISGASFKLLKHNGKKYDQFNSVYSADSGVPVDSEGKLSFTGLPNGEYQIIETVTPNGYIRNSNNSIYIKVFNGVVTRYKEPFVNESTQRTAIGENESVFDITYKSGVDDNTPAITVGNTPGTVLPDTGGPGVVLCYIFGVMMIMIAGAVLIINRKYNIGN